jgi:zinc protease
MTTRAPGRLRKRPLGNGSSRSVLPRTVALLALAAAFRLDAQPAPERRDIPASKVERKNLAPVSKDVLRVSLPRPAEAVLDNGLAVLILEDRRFPTVQVQLQIGGAGPIHEPADRAGRASLTAQMLAEGTETRTSEQLAREIETLGAEISASSPFGSTDASISASGLSDNFDAWFALVADVLLHPSFPADEFAKLVSRTKAQLRQQRASAGFLSQEQFQRAVFGGHPAAVVSASEASLAAIAPDQLREWHRERYVPQRAVLGVAGDVRAADLVPRLNRLLAAWKPSGGKEAWPARPEPPAAGRRIVVDRPASVQSRIVLGGPALDRRDPDYIPLTVMNRVLGGGSASRLFLNLREEKGYTYGVYSLVTALKYPGSWRAFGDVRTEVTADALKEFVKEFRRLREEPVPPAELEEHQRAIVASFALSLEQPAQLLGYALTRKIYGLPDDYWDVYPARVMAVTAAEIQRVAAKYVDLDRLQIVAVGDAARIRPALEAYGPVEVVDTDGKPRNP